MAKHEFGGDWTAQKLGCLEKYLRAYVRIFKKNVRARYYTITYVDAFAGTGQIDRKMHEEDLLFANEEQGEREAYMRGSARIALETDPGFDRYLFVERSKGRHRDLDALCTDFVDKHIVTRVGDANTVLGEWCLETDWRRNRALVFLDPYGMQVEWKLLQSIASTQAIDLWLLFPLGVAVNRLITGGDPPVAWARALSRTFGTDEWRLRFYTPDPQMTLFETNPGQSAPRRSRKLVTFLSNG